VKNTIKKLSMNELNRKTVDECKQSEKAPVIIVLENIRSMYNVGSVFRTADAFLIEAIYICGYTAQPPRKEINKTALGATDTVLWKYFSKSREAIEEAKEMDYKVFAIEQVDKSISLEKFNEIKAAKIALVFGNEVSGVDEETILLCDGCIEIPQFGMKHSLNISVAVGIVLWEVVRTMIFRIDRINRSKYD
jgi:23S rRNA (guanosine2251-2'-O)-methyltransferase